jgi:hypothetical protein
MSNSETTSGDSDDDILAYTCKIRKQLVTSMIKSGMPGDTKEQAILLTALADMDRTALGKKKIKSDEGVSGARVAAAATLAQLFMEPRLKQLGQAKPGEVGVIPKLAEHVLMPELVLGELDEHAGTLNYETFTAGQQRPADEVS